MQVGKIYIYRQNGVCLVWFVFMFDKQKHKKTHRKNKQKNQKKPTTTKKKPTTKEKRKSQTKNNTNTNKQNIINKTKQISNIIVLNIVLYLLVFSANTFLTRYFCKCIYVQRINCISQKYKRIELNLS